MGYKVGYSLAAMTSLLEKIESEDIYNTGWGKLESSPTNPLFVNNLTSDYIGNWTIDYASQIPAALEGIRPFNIIIYTISDVLYQMTFYKNRVWTRSYDAATTTWTTWAEGLAADSMDFSEGEPLAPGAWSLWFDASGEEPVIKTFDIVNRRWLIVQPANMMRISVYDTTGKQLDFFTYMDNKMTTYNYAASFADFESHIANTTLHVTSAEKEQWDAAVDESDMQDMVDAAEATVEATIETKVGVAQATTSSQISTINAYQGTLDTHTGNTTIHPNLATQADWASRAEGNHTHMSDGRVTVAAANVVSGLIDVARIPATALERNVTVADMTALLALTSSDVQEGDSVYVTTGTSGGFETYFVVDESALGTMNAFLRFNLDMVEMTWQNIVNKPTTLAGFGITDAYSKDDIDDTVLGPYVDGSAQLVTDALALKGVTDGIDLSASTITSIDSARTDADDYTSQINVLMSNIGAEF